MTKLGPYPIPSYQVGDCRELLAKLPDECIDCVVSSPPYWGLRSYLPEGDPHKHIELGTERTYPQYVEKMRAVFEQVRRVLKAEGTLWLNLGDCYATGAGAVGECPGGGEQGARWKGNRATRTGANSEKHEPALAQMGPLTQPNRMPQPGLKPKDLVGIPWRVAFALQADGWRLRSDIIWSKPNPMPESVQSRPTKAHEYLFLFSKAESYYYDSESIAEQAVRAGSIPGGGGGHEAVGAKRNRRSVWTIPTEPTSEAHFATMPTKLVQPCILAGCPAGGVVLDPFGGSGTVGRVAEDHGRLWLLFDLSPAYAEIAKRRTAQTSLLRG
jgi:DNA modification methylase